MVAKPGSPDSVLRSFLSFHEWGDSMSATLSIRCPKCGKSGEVPEKFVGHLIHCKHCNQHFPVQPPAAAPPSFPLNLDDDIPLAPLSEEEERHAKERYEARVLSKNRNEHYQLDQDGHEIHSPREQWH